MASEEKGHQSGEQQSSAREGFGDDMGTRVGRPDSGQSDGSARLASQSDDRGIEGSILDDSEQSRKAKSGQSTGAGAEGAQSINNAESKPSGSTRGGSGGASAERSQKPSGDRTGSEPIEGRTHEHQGGYGGKGGAPRTSSNEREK